MLCERLDGLLDPPSGPSTPAPSLSEGGPKVRPEREARWRAPRSNLQVMLKVIFNTVHQNPNTCAKSTDSLRSGSNPRGSTEADSKRFASEKRSRKLNAALLIPLNASEPLLHSTTHSETNVTTRLSEKADTPSAAPPSLSRELAQPSSGARYETISAGTEQRLRVSGFTNV